MEKRKSTYRQAIDSAVLRWGKTRLFLAFAAFAGIFSALVFGILVESASDGKTFFSAAEVPKNAVALVF